jgi:hypothetical protein
MKSISLLHRFPGLQIYRIITVTYTTQKKKKTLNSVAVVRKRIIPTKRLPLVGEVSANL